MDFELELGTDVPGDLDLDAFIEAAPQDVYVRGMFISRAHAMLGARYEQIRPRLIAPPRGGFTSFTAYPIKDFHRVVIEAARLTYPAISDTQRVRFFARRDIEVYAGSTLGRVTMSVVSSPGDLIQRFEDVYARMSPGPWGMTAERLGPRAARVVVRNLAGVWTYIVGQCEGVCTSMGESPRVRGMTSGKSLDFTIEW
jgi:uncharacterized protein (TIGR02265 family)